MPCAISGTGMLLTKREFGLNFIVLLFFAFMDLCEVVYIIWTLKPVNDWTPAHEMAFSKISRDLRLVSSFEAILVREPFMFWIFKKQFSNLAPWNVLNLSLFTAKFWLGSFRRIHIKDLKELELGLVARIFAERLSVNDIFRWCWTEGDLYESRIFKFWRSFRWAT